MTYYARVVVSGNCGSADGSHRSGVIMCYIKMPLLAITMSYLVELGEEIKACRNGPLLQGNFSESQDFSKQCLFSHICRNFVIGRTQVGIMEECEWKDAGEISYWENPATNHCSPSCQMRTADMDSVIVADETIEIQRKLLALENNKMELIKDRDWGRPGFEPSASRFVTGSMEEGEIMNIKVLSRVKRTDTINEVKVERETPRADDSLFEPRKNEDQLRTDLRRKPRLGSEIQSTDKFEALSSSRLETGKLTTDQVVMDSDKLRKTKAEIIERETKNYENKKENSTKMEIPKPGTDSHKTIVNSELVHQTKDLKIEKKFEKTGWDAKISDIEKEIEKLKGYRTISIEVKKQRQKRIEDLEKELIKLKRHRLQELKQKETREKKNKEENKSGCHDKKLAEFAKRVKGNLQKRFKPKEKSAEKPVCVRKLSDIEREIEQLRGYRTISIEVKKQREKRIEDLEKERLDLMRQGLEERRKNKDQRIKEKNSEGDINVTENPEENRIRKEKTKGNKMKRYLKGVMKKLKNSYQELDSDKISEETKGKNEVKIPYHKLESSNSISSLENGKRKKEKKSEYHNIKTADSANRVTGNLLKLFKPKRKSAEKPLSVKKISDIEKEIELLRGYRTISIEVKKQREKRIEDLEDQLINLKRQRLQGLKQEEIEERKDNHEKEENKSGCHDKKLAEFAKRVKGNLQKRFKPKEKSAEKPVCVRKLSDIEREIEQLRGYRTISIEVKKQREKRIEDLEKERLDLMRQGLEERRKNKDQRIKEKNSEGDINVTENPEEDRIRKEKTKGNKMKRYLKGVMKKLKNSYQELDSDKISEETKGKNEVKIPYHKLESSNSISSLENGKRKKEKKSEYHNIKTADSANRVTGNLLKLFKPKRKSAEKPLSVKKISDIEKEIELLRGYRTISIEVKKQREKRIEDLEDQLINLKRQRLQGLKQEEIEERKDNHEKEENKSGCHDKKLAEFAKRVKGNLQKRFKPKEKSAEKPVCVRKLSDIEREIEQLRGYRTISIEVKKQREKRIEDLEKERLDLMRQGLEERRKNKDQRIKEKKEEKGIKEVRKEHKHKDKNEGDIIVTETPEEDKNREKETKGNKEYEDKEKRQAKSDESDVNSVIISQSEKNKNSWKEFKIAGWERRIRDIEKDIETLLGTRAVPLEMKEQVMKYLEGEIKKMRMKIQEQRGDKISEEIQEQRKEKYTQKKWKIWKLVKKKINGHDITEDEKKHFGETEVPEPDFHKSVINSVVNPQSEHSKPRSEESKAAVRGKIIRDIEEEIAALWGAPTIHFYFKKQIITYLEGEIKKLKNGNQELDSDKISEETKGKNEVKIPYHKLESSNSISSLENGKRKKEKKSEYHNIKTADSANRVTGNLLKLFKPKRKSAEKPLSVKKISDIEKEIELLRGYRTISIEVKKQREKRIEDLEDQLINLKRQRLQGLKQEEIEERKDNHEKEENKSGCHDKKLAEFAKRVKGNLQKRFKPKEKSAEKPVCVRKLSDIEREIEQLRGYRTISIEVKKQREKRIEDLEKERLDLMRQGLEERRKNKDQRIKEKNSEGDINVTENPEENRIRKEKTKGNKMKRYLKGVMKKLKNSYQELDSDKISEETKGKNEVKIPYHKLESSNSISSLENGKRKKEKKSEYHNIKTADSANRVTGNLLKLFKPKRKSAEKPLSVKKISDIEKEIELLRGYRTISIEVKKQREKRIEDLEDQLINLKRQRLQGLKQEEIEGRKDNHEKEENKSGCHDKKLAEFAKRVKGNLQKRFKPKEKSAEKPVCVRKLSDIEREIEQLRGYRTISIEVKKQREKRIEDLEKERLDLMRQGLEERRKNKDQRIKEKNSEGDINVTENPEENRIRKEKTKGNKMKRYLKGVMKKLKNSYQELDSDKISEETKGKNEVKIPYHKLESSNSISSLENGKRKKEKKSEYHNIKTADSANRVTGNLLKLFKPKRKSAEKPLSVKKISDIEKEIELLRGYRTISIEVKKQREKRIEDLEDQLINLKRQRLQGLKQEEIEERKDNHEKEENKSGCHDKKLAEFAKRVKGNLQKRFKPKEKSAEKPVCVRKLSDIEREIEQLRGYRTISIEVKKQREKRIEDLEKERLDLMRQGLEERRKNKDQRIKEKNSEGDINVTENPEEDRIRKEKTKGNKMKRYLKGVMKKLKNSYQELDSDKISEETKGKNEVKIPYHKLESSNSISSLENGKRKKEKKSEYHNIKTADSANRVTGNLLKLFKPKRKSAEKPLSVKKISDIEKEIELLRGYRTISIEVKKQREKRIEDLEDQLINLKRQRLQGLKQEEIEERKDNHEKEENKSGCHDKKLAEFAKRVKGNLQKRFKPKEKSAEKPVCVRKLSDIEREIEQLRGYRTISIEVKKQREKRIEDLKKERLDLMRQGLEKRRKDKELKDKGTERNKEIKVGKED
ncbi:trichohyalin-like [Palaemon carinicauda]|uniref:trichohyalin-like n=1 Tax=Palaemon carinicauda TaxID=392227 RepID=UPI0035B5B604